MYIAVEAILQSEGRNNLVFRIKSMSYVIGVYQSV